MDKKPSSHRKCSESFDYLEEVMIKVNSLEMTD